MAPSLPAAQPATYTFEGRTVRPLGNENDKAFALINALNDAQRKQAILGSRVSDLVLGPGQDGRTIQPEGIRASALSAPQQTMLLDLVREWTGIMNDAFAEPRMAEIRANLPDTYFAWSGPTTNGSAAYFRIQGPTLVIEYAPQRQRRPHPHHLSRSDQRLRCEVHAEVVVPPVVLALTMAIVGGAEVSAHRRDEYLQAARLAIDPGRVQIELDLTPGIALAEAIIADIDRNRDGSLSADEQRAYGRLVLSALELEVDGTPLRAQLGASSFPDAEAMRRGEGTIRLHSAATLPRLSMRPPSTVVPQHAPSGSQCLSGECAGARERRGRDHGAAARPRPARLDHRLCSARGSCDSHAGLAADQRLWHGRALRAGDATTAIGVRLRPPAAYGNRRRCHPCTAFVRRERRHLSGRRRPILVRNPR